MQGPPPRVSEVLAFDVSMFSFSDTFRTRERSLTRLNTGEGTSILTSTNCIVVLGLYDIARRDTLLVDAL